VRQELAGFKVPARWHVVEELPRGALGKVLRRALRAEASSTPGGSGSLDSQIDVCEVPASGEERDVMARSVTFSAQPDAAALSDE